MMKKEGYWLPPPCDTAELETIAYKFGQIGCAA